MKLKIVGFKVGQSRPTANRTISEVGKDVPSSCGINKNDIISLDDIRLAIGDAVWHTILKSDFISIRRVDE